MLKLLPAGDDRPGEWVVFATVAYPEAHVRETLTIEGIRFKPLGGMYDGAQEQSWLVHSEDFPRIAYLAEGEECLLVIVPPTALLEPLGQGWRGYLTDIATSRRKYIGRLVEVDQRTAEASLAYTYDAIQHRWWLVS